MFKSTSSANEVKAVVVEKPFRKPNCLLDNKSHLVLYLQDDAQQRYIDYVNDLAGGYLELLFENIANFVNELLVSPFSGALACILCAAEHHL